MATRANGLTPSGNFTEGDDLLHPLLARMDTKPDGTQPKSVGSQEQVLGGGGAIQHPVIRAARIADIRADEDGKRCLFNHLGVRVEGGYRIQDGSFADDDEMPGLAVIG